MKEENSRLKEEKCDCGGGSGTAIDFPDDFDDGIDSGFGIENDGPFSAENCPSELQTFQVIAHKTLVLQHDELESNLKKFPHRNGIWGLEAIVM